MNPRLLLFGCIVLVILAWATSLYFLMGKHIILSLSLWIFSTVVIYPLLISGSKPETPEQEHENSIADEEAM